MNRISRELLSIAKEVKALDEEGDGSGFQGLHDYGNMQENRLDAAQKYGKKYILHHKEGNLWRIQACKNFSNVKKGDFGGLIESEINLSHDGNCWVYDNAKVTVSGRVCDDAVVANTAWVDTVVCNNARVSGNAQVYENAIVYDFAKISGKSKIHGKARVNYNVKDQEITE